jgi:hypothetical protein
VEERHDTRLKLKIFTVREQCQKRENDSPKQREKKKMITQNRGEKRERVWGLVLENEQSNKKKHQRRLCEEMLKKNCCRPGVSIISDFRNHLFDSLFPPPDDTGDFIDAVVGSTEDGSNACDLLQSYLTAKLLQKMITSNLPSYVTREKVAVSRSDYLEWRLLSFVERADVGSIQRMLSFGENFNLTSVLNVAIRLALISECKLLDESLEWKIVESLVRYKRLDRELPDDRIMPIHEMLNLNDWNFEWFRSDKKRNTMILDRLLHRGVFNLDDKWTRGALNMIHERIGEVSVLEYAELHFKASVMHSLRRYLPVRELIEKMIFDFLF